MVASNFRKVVWESQSEKKIKQGTEYMERVSGDCLGKAHSRWQNHRHKDPEAGAGPACLRKNMEAHAARAEPTRLRVQVARAEPCSAFAPSEMGWFRQDYFIRQWVSMCSQTLVPFHTAELHFPGFSAVRYDHMTTFCPMVHELA